MEGETIKCRLSKGGSITVTFDDRVFPDPSCGQFEAGWWVTAPYKDYPNNFIEYFLSDAGILYTWSESRNYDKACGICVPWVRRAKEADSQLEEFLRQDELINRSFDAYR